MSCCALRHLHAEPFIGSLQALEAFISAAERGGALSRGRYTTKTDICFPLCINLLACLLADLVCFCLNLVARPRQHCGCKGSLNVEDKGGAHGCRQGVRVPQGLKEVQAGGSQAGQQQGLFSIPTHGESVCDNL